MQRASGVFGLRLESDGEAEGCGREAHGRGVEEDEEEGEVMLEKRVKEARLVASVAKKVVRSG